jgi:hypothetical protein
MEAGYLERMKRILTKCGFMKYNKQQHKWSFYQREFLKAYNEQFPNTTVKPKFEKGKKNRSLWILVGANGTGPEPTLNEQFAQIKDKKESGRRCTTRSQPTAYAKDAIQKFHELDIFKATIEDDELMPVPDGLTIDTSAQQSNQPNQVTPHQESNSRTVTPEARRLQRSIPAPTNQPTDAPHPVVSPTAESRAIVSPSAEPRAALISTLKSGAQEALALLNENDVKGAIRLFKQLALNAEGPTKKVKTSYYKTRTQIVGKKHKVKIKIPVKYVAITTRVNNATQQAYEKEMALADQFKKGKCCFQKEEKQFIATVLAMCPKLSGPASEVAAFGISKALLTYLKIDHIDKQLRKILPCKATAEAYIEKLAVTTMFVAASRLEENDERGIYFGSDKADDKVKKGMSKMLSKFLPSLKNLEFPYGRLFTVVLDSDAAGNKDSEGGEAAANSIKKLPNHDKIVVQGVFSDSGGGFVVENKKNELVKHGKCKLDGLVGNCALHNTQLTGTVPMQKLFESGGVGKRNVPQLLYLAYAFQIDLGRKLTRELLNEIRDCLMLDEEDELDEEEFMKFLQQIQTNEELLQAKPDDARWLYTASS